MAGLLSEHTLHGDHIYMRGVVPDDIPTIFRWNSNIDYMRYLSRSMPRFHTEDDMRNWMLKDDDEHRTRPWAICTQDGDQIIGTCAFKEIQWQARHAMIWLGIGDVSQRGKGYGTDAVRVMLRYAFTEMNLERIGLEVAAFNTGAKRSYEKCGFVLEGTLRRYMFREGRYWDMYLMSVLRDEWRFPQSTGHVTEATVLDSSS